MVWAFSLSYRVMNNLKVIVSTLVSDLDHIIKSFLEVILEDYLALQKGCMDMNMRA
jgi:hypothetical protein